MRRGEVWLINLDPTIGAEIRKTRPAVIVNDDAVGLLPLKVIVPITEWKDRYGVAPWMVRLDPNPVNGLDKLSAADAFQGGRRFDSVQLHQEKKGLRKMIPKPFLLWL
jgi:mRNA interferase MazF